MAGSLRPRSVAGCSSSRVANNVRYLADRALYGAKRAGRNQVILANDDGAPPDRLAATA